MSVANLLRETIVAVNYDDYLKESQKDWVARLAVVMSFPRTTELINGLLQMGKRPGAHHLRNGEQVYQGPICISGNPFVSIPLAVRASRADYQVQRTRGYQFSIRR
jgi:hypothetical protein